MHVAQVDHRFGDATDDPCDRRIGQQGFSSKVLCVALESSEASLALSTFAQLTIALVMSLTAPMKVGLANGAFRSRAACVALEATFEASLVLSILAKLTISFVMPVTVPVNAGLASGAFSWTAACVALETGFKTSLAYRRCPRSPVLW